ncbi:Growth hormone-inducible transmembrane protein [Hypsibius exemplaris]|uniref:Growth hormone-inducible transmembrane protein n=1 Tax=Hypsibius exemplaris TaxID=2072580 RepID=A0A1W0WCB5_HYPEX|nr:Growth hormone-inducible transmembrane protein [Hypsibius exemplaris]
MSLFRLTCSSIVPRTIFRTQIRNLTEEAPRMRRADILARQKMGGKQPTFKESLMAPATDTAFNVGKLALAGGAALGIGALCFYGAGMSRQASILDQAMMWPQYVQERIRSTYSYLGVTLGVTAGSAYLVAKSPQIMNMMMRSGWMSMIATMALLIGTGMLAQSIPYENTGSKHAAWLLHAAAVGAVIAPLTLLGGPLMLKASLYTAGIVGGLSAVAASAPSDKFLMMAGPLAIGLGVVVAASIGSAFVAPTTALGAGMYSISMYGGLLLFSGMMLYNTQQVVRVAETYPLSAERGRGYDPINQMIGLYMNIINIFVRVAMLLAGGGNRRR